MNCPACNRQLISIDVAGISVAVCKGGCGGIWFDFFEIQKFDEPAQPRGEELLNLPVDPALKINLARKRLCPHCVDNTMIRFYFSRNRLTEVDHCEKCGGYWLDAGELSKIRNGCTSVNERHQATKDFVKRIAEPKLAQMRIESDEQYRHARAISNVLHFLTRA